jgi:acetyl esterase/lipase
MAVLDIELVAVENDVEVGLGGSKRLLADIYRPPAGRDKRTAILHLHGGGFRAGSKAGVRAARPLAALGYTCVSGTYRFIGEGQWPAQLDDVKTYLRWMRDNAGQLGVEASNLVVLGYSAGAHLALVAAGDVDGVKACVAFYPPAGTRRPANGSHPLLGEGFTDAQWRSFSPINYVREGFPPVMLLHGTADQTIPVEDSVALYQAFRSANVPVELHVVEGVTHIFDLHPEFAEAAATWIDLFLDRHVANPRAIPSTEPGAR